MYHKSILCSLLYIYNILYVLVVTHLCITAFAKSILCLSEMDAESLCRIFQELWILTAYNMWLHNIINLVLSE